MSLLDAFLRDAWQQTVVKSDVWFAYRTDSAVGQGTQDDPWNGNNTNVPGNFDAKMSLIPANTTVHLGPGTFTTKGHQGWTPQATGLRIVGAGMEVTILKVSGTTAASTCAIGNPTSPALLNGFEVSDLTIDCNLAGNTSATAVGGIAVNGTHVLIRRIRVKDFGSKDSTTVCRAISAALSISTGSALALDCVIDSCVAELPSSSSHASGQVTCLHLGKAANDDADYHTACVIRDCYVDCGSNTKPFRGIEASGGVGTIVENNRILNCRYGGPYQNGTDIPTKDLVVRGNYYSNVVYGIHLAVPSTIITIGRIVLVENVLELETSATPDPDPYGIKIDGNNTAGRFKVLVVRGNLIRHKDGASGPSGSLGIRFNACTDAVVEDNVVNVATANNAVLHDYCTNVKVFNNQKSSGEFLPVYDTQTGKHDWELTNEAENAFLVR